MKHLIIILLLLPVAVTAQKQGATLIDSLVKELPGAKEDTNKVNILYNISFAYNALDPDEGIKYAQQTLDLANKLQWKKGIARANNSLGVNYQNKADFQKALKYYEVALQLFGEIDYKKGVATELGNMANVYVALSDHARAEEYCLKALKIHEAIGDKQGVARVTGNLGNVYKNDGDMPRALECYTKALKMHEALSDTPGIARVMGNMGDAYYQQSNYSVALEYEQKALKMHEASGNKAFAANVICNIGLIYADLSNLPQALEYDFKATKMLEALGNKQGEARIFVNISNVYAMQGDYPNSLEYALKALKMLEDVGDKQGIAAANGNIGNVYMQNGDYATAIKYLQIQLKMDEDLGDKSNAAQATMNIGYIYTRQKKYPAAIAFCLNAFNISEAIGRKHEAAQALYQVGDAYLLLAEDSAVVTDNNTGGKATVKIPAGKAARLREAISSLEKALDIGASLHSPDIMQESYQDLASAYKLNGDFRKALESYQNYAVIKDSLFSKDNEKKMLKTAMQYDYDKQHFTDSLKSAERENVTSLKLQHQRSYTYIGIAGSLMLLGFLFFMSRNNKLLTKEKKRSEDLLLNILPEEVANELKDKGSAGTRYFDHVTVLFTDFVNFTQAGENMSPQALINELHTCFKAFDEITARYNVEKIKTIGDAYLAVAGLPVADEKHAEKIVRMAIDIHDFMDKRYANLGDKTFKVRIGIHSGSVVAGIVGVKKFAYDIWGDTVNVAARMEQNSEPEKINISQATYELIQDRFNCTYRGEIDAKNKGMLGMYFVDGLKM